MGIPPARGRRAAETRVGCRAGPWSRRPAAPGSVVCARPQVPCRRRADLADAWGGGGLAVAAAWRWRRRGGGGVAVAAWWWRRRSELDEAGAVCRRDGGRPVGHP